MKDTFLLEEMTWEEAKEKFPDPDGAVSRRGKKTNIAVLPIGSLEQHGPHLPLSTDAFDAYWLAKETVKKIPSPKPIVLPPINYGISYHHLAFPGTVSLSPETLIALVYDIGCSLTRYGIKKLLIINGHGGNKSALGCAAQKLTYEKKLKVFIDSGEIASKEQKTIVKTPNDAHSGEYETSTSLANRESLVRKNKIKKSSFKFPSSYLEFSSPNRIGWVFTTDELSKSGVLGDPSKADKSKGKKLWEAHIKNLVEFIEQLKKM